VRSCIRNSGCAIRTSTVHTVPYPDGAVTRGGVVPKRSSGLGDVERPEHWNTSHMIKSKKPGTGNFSRLSLPPNKQPILNESILTKRRHSTAGQVTQIREQTSDSIANSSFKPSWMKSTSGAHSIQAIDSIDEITDVNNCMSSPSFRTYHNTTTTMIHPSTSNTNSIDNPLIRMGICSPQSERRGNRKPVGSLGMRLAKISRLVDAEESRMANITEFSKGDINDPRRRAHEYMDVVLLQGRLIRESPPFLLCECIVRDKGTLDHNRKENMMITVIPSIMEKIELNIEVNVYFKEKSRIFITLSEGKVIRIFDPQLLTVNGRCCVICAHIHEYK
jgi:hypothetical protein